MIITTPSSPHTHLSLLPLLIINDPLDEILPMNPNLEEHFDQLDLEIPHISPTREHVTKPILKPIEPAPTPSLQLVVIHPIEKPTHKEPPASKELQEPSTS